MTLADARPAYLLADKGYDSDAIRNALQADGIRPTSRHPMEQANLPRAQSYRADDWPSQNQSRHRHPVRQARTLLH